MKIYHFILLAILMLAASCSSIDEPDTAPASGSEETCDLVVTLAAELPVATDHTATRSGDTWGDPYPEEEGLPDEKRIENMCMYLAIGDVVYPLTPTLLSTDEHSYSYKCTIPLRSGYVQRQPDGSYLLTGRLVAMANMENNVIPASPFTYTPIDLSIIDRKKVIPMWGVTSLKNLRLENNKTVDCGQTIKLLRAVPKLTFELADDFKDTYCITAVTSPRNDFELTGYCQPGNSENVSTTTALGIEDCFNPAPAGSAKGGIPAIYGLGTDKVWLYTGESKCNVNAGEKLPAYFNITLKRRDGTGLPITGNVYLCDYSAGQPNYSTAFPRLVRNHDYQYIISLSKLEFLIEVREWIFGGKVHIELE